MADFDEIDSEDDYENKRSKKSSDTPSKSKMNPKLWIAVAFLAAILTAGGAFTLQSWIVSAEAAALGSQNKATQSFKEVARQRLYDMSESRKQATMMDGFRMSSPNSSGSLTP